MLDHIIAIVKEAAALTREAFSVHNKSGDADVVTTADENVQRFLHEKLACYLPGSGFVAEEGLSAANDADYVWIIDPIDGTMNFSRGIRHHAISVALAHKGEVIIGVVYAPATDDLYVAQKGRGAFHNGKPMAVSDKPFRQGLLCTAMSLYRKEYTDVCLDIIRDAYGECSDIRRFGTAALELCYLADGLCDLYFEIRIFPWDYAAGYLILTEAGGILTGFAGDPLTLDCTTPLIGANNEENYRRLSEIVGRYMTRSLSDEITAQRVDG